MECGGAVTSFSLSLRVIIPGAMTGNTDSGFASRLNVFLLDNLYYIVSGRSCATDGRVAGKKFVNFISF